MSSGYTSNERDKPTGVRCATSRKGQSIPAFKPKAGSTQSVAYTGTAGTIANPTDALVLAVMTTTLAHIRISSAGDAATTADMPLPANVVQYFAVDRGDKVSAIQVSTGGNLHVTEME